MYPYHSHRSKAKYNSSDDKPKYYCLHCGHKTHSPQWSYLLNHRCPRCGAATKPAKW